MNTHMTHEASMVNTESGEVTGLRYKFWCGSKDNAILVWVWTYYIRDLFTIRGTLRPTMGKKEWEVK